MKKLLALLLSMVMAASLAVPAFADGPDGPAPDDYDYEDAVPISAPIDEDFDWWTVEDEWASVCEWYPERVTIFLEEVETWFAQHADQYDGRTFDEFVEDAGGKEAAYLSLFYDWKWEREEELARNELITALGGVPGQIGVRVNNEYIKFPDAAPEMANSRTMTPVRALIETLGGEADFVDGKVICKTDEICLTFTPGSNEVLVEYLGGELPGDGQMFPLDCAPYIKGGRTYVPVRFIGEALGYEVGWDGEYQTAILLDREALAAKIDEDFTILNRVQANRGLTVEEGKSWRETLKGSVVLTAFDTLNGNQTYKLDLTGKTLLGTEAVNGIYSVTISDNAVDRLMEMLIGGEGPEYEADAAILRTVITGLKDMEIIMNRDGLAWVHAPVLDKLSGEKDVWCGFDMGQEIADTLFAGGSTANATVGTMLAGLAPVDSVVMSSEMDNMVLLLASLYADDKFTTSGGVSTLTIGADGLYALYAALGMSGAAEYKEFNLTMKVDGKGGVTVTGKMETKGRYGTPAVRVTIDGSQDSGGAKLTLTCHVANVGELKLTLDASRQTTGETPVSEPPEGANIVDTPELLEGVVREGYSNEQ